MNLIMNVCFQPLFQAVLNNSDENQVRELKMELERATSKVEHLRSQNEVLTLTLEDSKSLTDRLTVLLGKYESNAGALQLGLNYCDHMVESYDVLVALLETEADILSCQDPEKKRQARNNRKSAEIVARHLVSRMDKSLNRSDSGIQTSHHLDTSLPWEDSSGYSQTTRYERELDCIISNGGFLSRLEVDPLELYRHQIYPRLSVIFAVLIKTHLILFQLYQHDILLPDGNGKFRRRWWWLR